MSGAARSASTCRSTSSSPMISSRRPSSSPRTCAARERLHAKLEKDAGRAVPERRRRASRRWSLGRRSAGRCSIGSAVPTSNEVRDDRPASSARSMGEDSDLRLVNFDWIEPAREVRIRIDQDQARLLGLSSQALADVLNTVMTGTPVTQVRDGIYLVNVVVRADDEQRVSLSTLRTLQVPLPNGRTVPLSQVASFDFDQEFPLIWRRDRVPTLTVQADVARRRDARGRRPLASAGDRETARKPAGGLPHRGLAARSKKARNRRPRYSRCVPADAVPDADVPDDPAAEFRPRLPRHCDRSDGADRRRRSRCCSSAGRSASSPSSAFWR